MSKKDDDERKIRKLYHSGGRDTERKGAEYIAPKLSRLRAEVFEFAKSCGERGFTQQDLADAKPSKNWSSYRSRVVELERLGLVEDTGRRKHHVGHAREHIIWRVCAKLPPSSPQRDLFEE